VVSNNGIEVNPDKVKAIQAILAPKSEKEVQSFLGGLKLYCSIHFTTYSYL
jgi:hypothetical protein